MNILTTDIPGVLIIEPKVFGDDRGYFIETYQTKRYADAGIYGPFVQDNVSFSSKGTLRGLHVQNLNPQGKLVQVLIGEVYDVAVDIRRDSPTFGKWVGLYLSASNNRQFWIPPGLAHGFYVKSETALFAYKCTDYYSPKHEMTLAWDDPEIGIHWPIDRQPTLSEKDKKGITLADLNKEILSKYRVLPL